MTERKRIVVSEEDLLAPEPAPAPAPPPLPPIAGPAQPGPAAGPAPAGADWLYTPVGGALAAAAVGMVAAWAVTQLTGIADITPQSKVGSDAIAGLWVAVIAVVFVGVATSFDRALAGAWPAALDRALRAAVPAALIGFVSGFLANVIYLELIEHALEQAIREFRAPSPHLSWGYLARLLGWGIFGAGVGATVGLAERAPRRALNGALGGAAGGAAGGLAFQYLAVTVQSEGLSRLVGLLAIGALIALATRAVETARRQAWLSIAAGGMRGKEFILYHPVTRIGSDPSCEIFLPKDRAVAGLHAEVTDSGRDRRLAAAPGCVVQVNGAPVTAVTLRPRDVIGLGSTQIAYSERELASPALGASPLR